MKNRKLKDKILNGFIYLSVAFTVGILVIIIGFIFIKGYKGINIDFLTNSYEDKTNYVTVDLGGNNKSTDKGYISKLGIILDFDNKNNLYIKEIDKDSPVKNALTIQKKAYSIKVGDQLTKIGDYNVKEAVRKESKNGELISETKAKIIIDVKNEIEINNSSTCKLKVVRVGGGIIPMVVTTLYMIVLSLIFAAPIGILSAVYLNEYAKQGKLVNIIRFAVKNLAGIPSIIYGLFGALFFVQICGMKYSILAGSLTVSIILLPTIISTTEETLKSIPKSYRESSLGLGATKLQTIFKVILPNGIQGILVSILLSIGRIIGESAALILTAGTVASIPTALTGSGASGATLTIKAYTLMKEENDIQTACSIGIILILLIVILNITSKLIVNKFTAKNKI